VKHKKVENSSNLKFGTKKWRKTHASSEAQKSGEKLIPQVRHKKVKKTHTSSEAQKSGNKHIPQMRHKKADKNSYLK
jgi:hypothetical protein